MGKSSFTGNLSSSSDAEGNDHRIIPSSRNIRAYKVTAVDHETGTAPPDIGGNTFAALFKVRDALIFFPDFLNNMLRFIIINLLKTASSPSASSQKAACRVVTSMDSGASRTRFPTVTN